MQEETLEEKPVVPKTKSARYSWWTIGIVVLTLLEINFIEFPYQFVLALPGIFIFWFGPVILNLIDYLTRHITFKSFVIFSILWILLAFSLIAILLPGLLGSRRSAWENQCKLVLRSLGSTQLAWADEHDGNYASWEQLISPNNLYIQEGYTKENLIGSYSIIAFDTKPWVKKPDGSISESTFTIVAVPHYYKKIYFDLGFFRAFEGGDKSQIGIEYGSKYMPRYLRTFALGEDQTPRVWIGDSPGFDLDSISLHDEKLWEPLR